MDVALLCMSGLRKPLGRSWGNVSRFFMIKLLTHQCVRCSYKIDERIYKFSSKELGYSLCFNCQEWFKSGPANISKHAKLFALELQSRNVNLEMEKNDGFKHIDIAIPSYFLNLEIDGSQHYTNVEQCTSDIKRTCRSLEKGFVTIRIPNILIEKEGDRKITADEIVRLLVIRKKQIELENKQNKIGNLLREFYQNNLLVLKG